MEPREAAFPNIKKHDHVDILSLDNFTPAFNEHEVAQEEVQRRFSTFLVPSEQGHKTSISNQAFRCAYNTSGEQCALKSPLFVKGTSLPPKPDSSANNGLQEYDEVQQALLLEEYRNSLALSHVKGFPRVYGLGSLNDEPIMVREYVAGITLAEAMDHLPRNNKNTGLAPAVVAALGKCTLHTLIGAHCLKGTFVHRDLSPRNIIIRTSKHSLKQQAETLQFDICLVDLGSASYRDIDLPCTTEKYGIWRFGTAEYAPPEMLTRDVEGIEAKRYSETIDTYALCSILYLMLTFTTPYVLMQRINESPYLIKKNELPREFNWSERGEDSSASEALLKLVAEGITPKQADRYCLRQMYKALQDWQNTFHSQLGIKCCPPPRGIFHLG